MSTQRQKALLDALSDLADLLWDEVYDFVQFRRICYQIPDTALITEEALALPG